MQPFTQHFCSNYTSQFTLGRASVPSAEEKVRQIIMDQLGLEASEVKLHTSFVDDLRADSRDLMEVVMGPGESFALEIQDGKAEKIRTVQERGGLHSEACKVGSAVTPAWVEIYKNDTRRGKCQQQWKKR